MLTVELDKTLQLLELALGKLVENGTKLAEAEREYNVEKSKEALKLKDAGNPITFIQIVIKGIVKIADLRFKRDVAEVIYKANLESINIYKLKIRILEKAIETEWGNTK